MNRRTRPLPEAVNSGVEPFFFIIGAIAGGIG